MKKFNLLSGVLMSALVLAATGCSNDANEDSENVKVRITATSIIGSGATSRVALGDDNSTSPVALNWQSGDKIFIEVSNNRGELTLQSGEGTKSATFTGEITGTSGAMTACYPTDVIHQGTDLTSQEGTKEYAGTHNVMFASIPSFTTTPSFKFSSKTSILKFALPYPTGVTKDKVSSISATISGVNSSGTLGTDGNWASSSSFYNITVSNLTAGETTITGYAVVIPGSNVNAMRVKVAITDKNTKVTNYMVPPYTGNVMIEEGKIYPITKTLSTLCSWDKVFCKDCPTDVQIKMYLSALNGVYWDDGIEGDGQQTFIRPDGTESHKGIWLKKKNNINGFNQENANQDVTSLTFGDGWSTGKRITSSNLRIRTSGDYFFFPFYYDEGAFWSSTRYGESYAYALSFSISNKSIGLHHFNKGEYYKYMPWVAE